VYARLDGFLLPDGRVFLNDPNTTSGMLPSSFFFHQAAEIGLNPTQFITFIIHRSLRARLVDFRSFDKIPPLIQRLDKLMDSARSASQNHTRAAVILGGYSSERHISVESGRNIYEKLASSPKYHVTPLFLTGSSQDLQLYTIPINLLLKDNADDICEKVLDFNRHSIINRIIGECNGVTERFASARNLEAPQRISIEDLPAQFDIAFIALHGRPGEDGSIQKELDRVGLPYNGSGPASSQTTIDKFKTNELLAHNGFHVAGHFLGHKADWVIDPTGFCDSVENRFGYPCVAKPVDDGCSSAVRIIRNREQLSAYAALIFRGDERIDEEKAAILNIKFKEEFPFKEVVLFEELIRANGAERFIEITGGMLTSMDEHGKIQFEVFEASEALSEGDVLSLEEKFLAGQGQNITPARYSDDAEANKRISSAVKKELERAARLLQVEGYARIDAFVRIFKPDRIEVVFIEVNSLPGMTPATCIFHQAALAHYKPFDFIDKILDFGKKRKRTAEVV
ncbi:MAG: D-alanine--D-alanine ligase, partial [Bacteroidota bacterium]